MNDRVKPVWAEHILPTHAPAGIGANFHVPEGDILLRDAAAAMNGLAADSAKALETARLVFDDDSVAVSAQHLKVREVATAVTRSNFAKIADVRRRLEADIEKIAAATMAPPLALDPRQEIRRGNIAQGLRSTPPDTRNSQVIEEIKAGDVDLADAILNLPGIVTGYSKLDRESVREIWRRVHCAEQAERLDQLQAILDHTKRSEELARNHMQSLWGAGIVDRADRKSKAAADAIKGAAA